MKRRVIKFGDSSQEFLRVLSPNFLVGEAERGWRQAAGERGTEDKAGRQEQEVRQAGGQ
jgi:hypothetical protein